MEDYFCVTVLSRKGESEPAFSGRLSAVWTEMLRARKEDFEKVYAETTEFENDAGRLTRQYMIQESVVGKVEALLTAAGIDFQPVDRTEIYSKYEAVAPEWMQIEH